MPRQVQFTGRSREKAQILEALETHFLVMICGIAGSGKTALATEVAQQWKCRAADRQIAWISANDQTLDGGQVLNSFDAFLNAVARELDRPGLDAPTEEKIEELRKELGRRSCLLVVDSFEVINDEGGQISGFLANVPEPTKCLLTSRHLPLQLQDHPVIVRLGGMPLNETKELMESEAQLVSLSLRGVSKETLEELQERIGGHPLAVRWIVGQMHQTGQSLPTVVSRISEGNMEKKLDDMFSYAYGLLKPEAERILTILPVFGGPVLKEAIMYVGKISRSELDEGLAQLIGLSLVDMDDTVAKDRRCSIHPLTRQYANKLLRRSGTLYREAHLREAQWIIQFVAQLNPQTSTAPREQFELEMPNILSIAQWCSDNREWLALVDLVTATHHQMWEYGYRAEELRLDLLGFDASAQCGRYDAMWRTAYNIGWSEYRRGDYEKANEWATKAEQAIEDTSMLEVSP
ncbi:MAG: NB-ARC domain-containing protein, partial [Candidatus Thorarchaeota archaeon]